MDDGGPSLSECCCLLKQTLTCEHWGPEPRSDLLLSLLCCMQSGACTVFTWRCPHCDSHEKVCLTETETETEGGGSRERQRREERQRGRAAEGWRGGGRGREAERRSWWCCTDCRHCASVTSDAAELPQASTQEKEAKHNWTNRETKRTEAEVEKMAELSGKHQDTDGNTESGVRGNLETPSELGAGVRIDGQEQESCLVSSESGGSEQSRPSGTLTERDSRYETNGWRSKIRQDEGDRQLVC